MTEALTKVARGYKTETRLLKNADFGVKNADIGVKVADIQEKNADIQLLAEC